MDKIIIRNQEIEILSANSLENGLEIKTGELTLATVETLFPTTDIVSFEIANEAGEVYGKYANLKTYAIVKNATELEDGTVEETISVKLGVVNNTTVRLNQVEEAVDTLVMASLGI